MKTIKFFDKTGTEIYPGMYIKIGNDGPKEVIEIEGDDEDTISLGISAMNPEYLKRHPDTELDDYYALSDFDPKLIEIV